MEPCCRSIVSMCAGYSIKTHCPITTYITSTDIPDKLSSSLDTILGLACLVVELGFVFLRTNWGPQVDIYISILACFLLFNAESK